MPELGKPQNTIELMKRHQFRFRKKFGQNFLVDPHVLEKIAEIAEISPGDGILEIGPGLGTLTQYLAERARRVVAVEIDPELIPILRETLGPYPNAELVHGDILEQDLGALSERFNDGKPFSVVANLPYYITTPVIMKLLGEAPVRGMTVMVQREVAERMQASPGSKTYGALSLAVQYYARAEIRANVPPNCFIPRPKVGSSVIQLKKYEVPPTESSDAGFLFRVVRAAFNQRRKTLANALGNVGMNGITRARVSGILRDMGLPETVRGEALSLAEFAALSERLLEEING